jgi:hypothetical protein
MNTFASIHGGTNYAAAVEAAEAKGQMSAVRRGVDEVEARLDRTLLAVEAMWTLLHDRLDVADVELVERINELDLSDGQLDGKARKAPVSCPSCGRAMSRRFPRCMYCGQAVVHDPFA